MSKSIVIIGGGVIGLCTAHYAVQSGHHVTILERNGPDHESCAVGSAGMIVPSHFIPLAAPGMIRLALRSMWNSESAFAIRPRIEWDLVTWGLRFLRSANARHVRQAAPLLLELGMASRACFEELAESDGNAFDLQKKGLLILCRTEHGLQEEARTVAMAQRLGMDAEMLTAAEVGRMEPGARLNIEGAGYFPSDCHVQPARFVSAMVRRLADAGVMFCWQTEVTGWRVQDGRVHAVLSNAQEFRGDEYVLAGGAWSSRVAEKLGFKLPLQPGKGYSLTLPNPRALPTIPAILSEARVAVTSMGSSLRVGGTMEIAGYDAPTQPGRVRGIVKAFAEYYPDFCADDFREVPVWTGLRPLSPDGLPYLGRVARFENLSVATGHGMLGLSLGPITGKLLAQILSGEAPCIDLTLLDPGRFARWAVRGRRAG